MGSFLEKAVETNKGNSVHKAVVSGDSGQYQGCRTEPIQQTFSAWVMSGVRTVFGLRPSEGNPRQQVIRPQPVPKIVLSQEAYLDTQLFIELSGIDEISWLGAVEEREGGIYYVPRIFLPRQQVGRSHAQINPNDLGVLYRELLASEEDRQYARNILFWAHVHPDENVEPSFQDDEQMEQFSHNPFFIRAIFSRDGHVEFTFFDYKNGCKTIGCPWDIERENPERYNKLRALVRERVRKDDHWFGLSRFSQRRPSHGFAKSSEGLLDSPSNLPTSLVPVLGKKGHVVEKKEGDVDDPAKT